MRFIVLFVVFTTLLLSDIIVKSDSNLTAQKRVWLPYAFSTESFGLSAGVAVIQNDVLNEGNSWIATAFASKNDAQFVSIYTTNYRPSWSKRLTIDGGFYLFPNPAVRGYFPTNPFNPVDNPSTMAGSNSSSPDDYVETEGNNNFGRILFHYLLPWGDGADNIDRTIHLTKGIVSDGSVPVTAYNPLKSGRSYINIIPSREVQVYTDENSSKHALVSNVVKFEYAYENVDFNRNPSYGSKTKISLARDFGWFDSEDQYTYVTAEYTKYFSLGSTNRLAQQVIALNAWTADTPSWVESATADGKVSISGRPTPFDGAKLGGIYRLRAYPTNRYNSRAAIYYSAEYRATFKYNPISQSKLLQPFQIDWFQGVVFAETGRVSNRYDLKELHSDMKYDAGVGLRSMIFQQVFRFDVAYGEEGTNMWVMFGHPF